MVCVHVRVVRQDVRLAVQDKIEIERNQIREYGLELSYCPVGTAYTR
jgi:hypothetical protein